MQYRRNIALFLLFSFSVILGHSIIPHHHHDVMFVEADASSCPFEGNDQNDHHDHTGPDHHPEHCHAFNEIAFYKVSLPGANRPLVLPSLFSAPADLEESLVVERAAIRIIVPQRENPIHILFGRSIALRGPPFAG